MRPILLLFIVSICLLLISGMSISQEATGRISGKVIDENGEALPGVNVEATSPSLVGTATATTDRSGVYRLFALTPGEYKIQFSLPGFVTTIREGIAIRMEETLTVNVTLPLQTLEEEINVIAQQPLIDVKSTSAGMNISKETFSTLPRSRDISSVAKFISGVNEEPQIGGLSVDGASGGENVFYVDGTDISNIYTGSKGQETAFEFVEEIQMKSSGYQAEFGGSLGGVLNVITRSGGNEFHGELFSYYSGSMLAGKERDSLRINPWDTTQAEYVNYQDMYGKDTINSLELGINLGGYIIKDRLWFFGAITPKIAKTTRAVEWLISPPVPGSEHSQNWDWYNGSLKVTSNPFGALRLSASYTSNFSKHRGDLPARDGSGDHEKSYGDYGFDYPNWSASSSADYSIGNNLILHLRGGFFHRNRTNQQVTPEGPMFMFRNEYPETPTTNAIYPEVPEEYVRARGWRNMSLQDLRVCEKEIQNRASLNFDVTYYINFGGEHSLKSGIQWIRLEDDTFDSAKYEAIFFGWDTDFVFLDTGERVRGKYGNVGIYAGDAGPYGMVANPVSTRWAFFIQDSWTPSFLNNRLTLNMGIRAESESIPSFSSLPEYQDDPISFGFKDKLAPRLGFIYDLFGDSSTKVFGSFGIYYDVMKLNMAKGSFGGWEWYTDYYTLDHWDWTQWGNGNYPGTYLETYNWRIPSFDTTDPDLKPMSQSELTFGFEQQLTRDVSTSVRIIHNRLLYAIEDVGILGPQGENYYIANPGYGYTLPESQGGLFDDELPVSPKAKRNYWAVNLNLDKRFSNNWVGGFSYTWSRLHGNYDGLSTSPNTGRVWDQWYMNWTRDMQELVGPLTADRPHQFKAFGSYAFDFGLTLGLFARAMSGTPVQRTMSLPISTMIDGRITEGRTPFLFTADAYTEYNLKITDKYKIQLNLNVDNIFNVKTAQRIFEGMSQTSVVMTNEERVAGWSYDENNNTVTTINRTIEWVPDPRFLMEYDFYQPINARVGVKIIF